MDREYLLLTGSTGFVGQYVLRALRERGAKVALVGRAAKGLSLEDRIVQILGPQNEREVPERYPLKYLQGDICKADLGLSHRDRAWVASNVHTVLHCAANVKFFDSGDGEVARTNVGGTRGVVSLCELLGITRLLYVSTAFVCGDREGPIFEDELDQGQSFGSDYERSKFEAEKLLSESSLPCITIARPAAVTSAFDTGHSSTFHGIYSFVRFTHLSRLRAGAAPGERWNHAVRIARTGEERFSLVPVDWVASVIAELATRPDLQGLTYHLTGGRATHMREIESALADYFGYEGVRFVGSDSRFAPESEVEQLFYASLDAASHRYWEPHPHFDTTNLDRHLSHLPCPGLDQEYFMKLIDYAVDTGFGKSRSTRSSVARSAGVM